MSSRPFDDDRYPDQEGFGACFICGKKVDPLDPNRGTYEVAPSGCQVPIHVPCAARFLSSRPEHELEILYRKALDEMADFNLRALR